MTPMVLNGALAHIVTDDWFAAPDGVDYKGAWGRVVVHNAKELFGFDPKAGAAYFLQVGEGEGAVLIAGCKLHYAVLSSKPPHGSARCYIPPSERSRA